MLNPKKENFYFQTFIASWKTVWQNKVLWFFGLFALFLSSGQWYDFFYHSFSSDFLLSANNFILRLVRLHVFSLSFLVKAKSVMAANPFPFFILFLIFFLILAIFFFFVWLAVVAQGGLIASLLRIKNGEKPTAVLGLRDGKRRFWDILSLNIIYYFFVWTPFMVLGLCSALHNFKLFKFWTVALFIFFLLVLPFLIVISFVFNFSLVYLLAEPISLFQAIKKSFRLFFRHFITNVEIAIYLFLVNYIFKYLVALMVFLLLIPLSSLGTFSLYLSSGFSFNFYFFIIPLFIVALVLWLTALLTAYNYSVWVSAFSVFVKGEKIPSLFKRIFSRQA